MPTHSPLPHASGPIISSTQLKKPYQSTEAEEEEYEVRPVLACVPSNGSQVHVKCAGLGTSGRGQLFNFFKEAMEAR